MTDESLDQEKLDNLARRTALLPREMEPPADAWMAIKAAIEVPRKPVGIAVWQRPAFLAAAGLLLVAGSSAITAVAIGRGVPREDGAAIEASSDVLPSGVPATLAEFTIVENDYISTANRLLEMVEGDQVYLTPETIEKLRESVRVIDAAIIEARRALAEDPANPQLIEMLSTSYNQKLDLLRRTADMGRS
ncbi:MAG: hypothetical protein ACR2GK_08105 [Gemmatimonadaceae bacterium]